MKLKLLYIILLVFFGMSYTNAQVEKYTLSGQITDASTGEDLINATVYIYGENIGTVSNLYGFYSLTIPKGNYELVFSYIGYKDSKIKINLNKNISKNIELGSDSNILEDIVIVAKQKDENIKDVEMSKIVVDVETVKKMPALFGEVDIIKAIQILPGIKSIGEATSGFYVRGGNADQNLVLLDEAPIYNASHMLGFFSSFNPDAIKDMQIYKGAIPAIYGGRLSSVLDIRMKEGNTKKFAGALGIGTMMSRLTLEAPISDKGSFMISGRRSYLDVLIKAYTKIAKKDNPLKKFFFYDLNVKANYRLNKSNRLFVSGYMGRDVISSDEFGKMNWGNITSTVRWNHVFSPKLFSNLTMYYSNYDYLLKINGGLTDFTWGAILQEWSGKLDITYFLNPKNTIKFGLQSIKHDIQPGNIKTFENKKETGSFKVQQAKSIENAFYINNTQDISNRLRVTYGLRLSSLSNLGPYTSYRLNDKHEIKDSINYSKGSYNDDYNIEPRIGLRYRINRSNSIKVAYNRTVQYIQQASNGNTATPLDIWFTSNNQIKPQLADQFSLGFFKNFNNNSYEASIEVYYKKFTNAIDFKEGAELLLNKNIDGELRYGEGKAYGVELLIKKQKGKFTGQIAYTYSKIRKKINTINNNKWYNAKYDQPHNMSLVVSYQLSNRWSISSNFVVASGNAVTFPTGRFNFGGTIIPVYSERNGARLPVYHRMDFSITRKAKRKLFKYFDSEWVFSIYNVYNRKNAYSINFRQDDKNPNVTYAEKIAVFGIVPSFTFNAKF